MSNAPIWVYRPADATGEPLHNFTRKHDPRCAYWVFSGHRDVRGHQCTRQEFRKFGDYPACYVHYNLLNGGMERP